MSGPDVKVKLDDLTAGDTATAGKDDITGAALPADADPSALGARMTGAAEVVVGEEDGAGVIVIDEDGDNSEPEITDPGKIVSLTDVAQERAGVRGRATMDARGRFVLREGEKSGQGRVLAGIDFNEAPAEQLPAEDKQPATPPGLLATLKRWLLGHE